MSPAYLTQDPQQLLEMVRKLEARVTQLEKTLGSFGGTIELSSGNSTVKVQPNKVIINASEIEFVSSGKISLKASGQLVMKGTKITEN